MLKSLCYRFVITEILPVFIFDKLSNVNDVDVCWKQCIIFACAARAFVQLRNAQASMQSLVTAASYCVNCVLVWISTVWEKLWWLYFLILQHARAHDDEVTILFWFLLTNFWETCMCTVNDVALSLCVIQSENHIVDMPMIHSFPHKAVGCYRNWFCTQWGWVFVWLEVRFCQRHDIL